MCEAHSARSATETWTLVRGFKQNELPTDARNAVFHLLRIFQSGRNPNPESSVRKTPLHEARASVPGQLTMPISSLALSYVCVT